MNNTQRLATALLVLFLLLVAMKAEASPLNCPPAPAPCATPPEGGGEFTQFYNLHLPMVTGG